MVMRHLLCGALLVSISAADSIKKKRQPAKFDKPDTSCHPETSSSCTLDKQFDSFLDEDDDLPYDLYTCAFGRNMRFPGYFEYEPADSLYQDILFYTDIETKKDKDTCFDLDGTVQICGSYRPHYHELVVHYPARYVETVKRVVWVGGGDSMLLHEVLKYPTLELVVGLELDQTVTRHSFQHFGTQPHWDNDKVEWWYGDAAKSLMMLPKDYFGSFDLVLVDLSETVMSISVTDGLDIFGALALLLTDKGIIVKNELYLEHFSEIFDYTMQVHAYDIPVICSQAVVLGSYGNDYLTKTPVKHEVGEMIFDALKDPGTYQDWHDYRRNDTNTQAHCRKEEPETKELVDQDRSPGILMIIEAEEVSINLTSLDSVKDVLVTALEKEGLTVQSSVMSSPDDIVIAASLDQKEKENDSVVGQVVIVLHEGYVVARVWAQHKYVAFDLHLWSDFDRQENIQKSLLSAVGNSGGKTSSSYRIVAGGMFGMSEWKIEETNRGPRRTQECDKNDKESSRVLAVETSAVVTMLTESINLIQDKDIVVAVFCGQENEPCVSVDVVKEHEKVATVVPIYACPGIQGINEYMEDAQQRMGECQKEMVTKLRSLPADKKYRGIVVDGSVSFTMGQLIHKIFRIKKIKDALLNTDECMVLANIKADGESWRRNLLDRFRRDILTDDPIFRAEILFNSTDTTMEMGIVNIGDSLFVEKLMNAVAKIETATGLVSDVRNIQGGMFTFIPNFVPTLFALPGEYDQSSPLEQWNAQQPLGHQTVLQLELQAELVGAIVVGTRVEVTYSPDEIFHGTVEKVVSAESFGVQFDDGDEDEDVDIDDIRYLGKEVLNLEPLSRDVVKGILKKTILAVKTEDDIVDDDVKVLDFKSVGEGYVFISFWSGGSVLLLWDGRNHVDLNLFTYTESVAFSKGFGNEFEKTYPLLKPVLRDEQPRGFGRVVNFVRDLGEPRDTPHWSM